MYLIEFRFLVKDEPKDKYKALFLVKQQLKTNLMAEEYIRWKEFIEEEKSSDPQLYL